MVKTKVEVKQEEVVVPEVPDPKPKIEFLKKMLSEKANNSEAVLINPQISEGINELVCEKTNGLRDSIVQGGKQIFNNDPERFNQEIINMKVDFKQKDISKKLLDLNLKQGVLDRKDLDYRINKLRSSIPRLARSCVDLDIEMEDAVGISSVRKVKNLVSLTGKFKEDENERKEKEEKAYQFIKIKDQERKELIKKRKEWQKKRDEKFLKEKEEEETKKKQEEEQKHQSALQRYEQTKERIEQNQKERVENSKPIRLNTDYLHDKLEKKYEQNVILPALEQKKMELEKIRNFYKPIPRSELDEHEKNFLIQLKQKQDEKKMKREIEYKKLGVGNYDPSKYKTKFYEDVIEKEKEDKLKLEEESEKVKNRAEKMDNYAKIVKEMHWPEVSARKREELEGLKKSLEERSKPPKRQMSKIHLAVTDNEGSRSIPSHKHTKSAAKIDWRKFHNPMLPKPQPKREAVVVDYLTQK